MRILVVAIGSDGDINPLLEISKELKKRDHEIVFFANGYFREKVEKEGIELVQLGDQSLYYETINNPDLWDARKGFQAVWNVIRPYLKEQYLEIENKIKPGDTAVVGSTLAFTTRLIQEKHGLKQTTVHLQPSVILSAQEPPYMPGFKLGSWVPLFARELFMQMIDEWVLDKVVKDDINELREDIGLAPIKNIMSKWMHSPDKVLLAFPDWYSPPQSDWPGNHEFTGFPVFFSNPGKSISENTGNFLKDGEPPIVVTAGSANAHSNQFFKAAIDSVNALGKRAVLVNKFADLNDLKLSDNILVSPYEPFDLLFPKASAIVHHGGVGTTAQCLYAGVPQMIAPFAHDQFDNAGRIESLKVGKYAKSLTLDEWTTKLNALLKESMFKTNSDGYSKQMKEGESSASRAASAIEMLGV